MRKRTLVGLGLVILAWSGASWAQGCFWDDTKFFTTAVKPNVFLLLDRSGSMCWAPSENYYPCADGYSSANCTRNGYGPTSKVHLAVDAIRTILDADTNGVVEDRDSLALNVRLGYGHYIDSYGETNGTYIPYNNDTIGTRYGKLWSDASNEYCCGGTPLNRATWDSKELVRNTHVREGLAWNCRKSFLILITDGEDTWGCGGGGSGGNAPSRRAGVNVCYTSNRNDTIPVFVIGFGATMPLYLRNTLNWMAYKGGTDNLLRANSGDTMCYPALNTGTTYQTCGNNSAVDPGNCDLDGYAFIATNGSELRAALASIFSQIQQSSGSTFSPPSVPANFTAASFLLVNNFDAQIYPKRWQGHLGAFAFKNDGSMPLKTFPGVGLDTAYLRWDAGNILRKRNIVNDPRTIYTAFKGPSLFYLNPLNDTMGGGNVKPESLGLATGQWDSLRTIVNYVYYDTDSGNAKFGWMGDPFHAGPLDVGPPNPYFTNDTLYADYVYNLRTLHKRPRRVYSQTNDGMLHIFRADTLLDSTNGGGRELCAIVPNHVRPWLRYMLYAHDYTLDGPMLSTHILVPELHNSMLWEWEDWRTILVCGERTGGRYYYALDITHPDSGVGITTGYPRYLWEYGAAQEPTMGYTFGKATVCRVYDSTAAPYRRYVAFLPGGYDCNQPGRGNFVLAVDAWTGELLAKIPLGLNGTAAQVRPVDLNYDGYVEWLYVGDMNGDVWRIILNNRPYRAQWHAKKLFQATAPYNKPIFGQVSVAADFQNILYIMWGTGDRNSPTTPAAQVGNAFFGLSDQDTITPYGMGHLATNSGQCQTTGKYGWYQPLFQNNNSYLEVFTNPVTVSDTVRVLAWSPAGSGAGCSAAGSGTDTLISYLYTCGFYQRRQAVGTGIPPYELSWGVDRRGNVTTLLPNLQKMVLGTLNRGKFIRVWREIY